MSPSLHALARVAPAAALALLQSVHAAEAPPPDPPPVVAVVEMGLVKQNAFVQCRDGTYSAMVGKKAIWTFNDTCLTSGGVLGDQFIDNTLAWNTKLDASQGITLNKDKKDADGVPVRFVPFTANEIAFTAARTRATRSRSGRATSCDDPARKRELIFFGAVYRGNRRRLQRRRRRHRGRRPDVHDRHPPGPEPRPERARAELHVVGRRAVVHRRLRARRRHAVRCYGGQGVGLVTHVHVARVPLADALDKTKWTYWDGTQWSAKNQKLATVYQGGAAGDTIFWDDYLGEFVTVYQPFQSNDVYYRVANHPEGPWSAAAYMFTAQQGTDPSYAARVHTEYQEGGGQVEYVTLRRGHRLYLSQGCRS